MIFHNFHIKLKWAFFVPLISLLFAASITASLFSAFILRQNVSKLFDQRFISTQDLFVQNIAADVLSGASSEVFRKCNELYNTDSAILSVLVRDTSGASICSLSKEFKDIHTHVIDTPVFFDEARTKIASTVQITYSDEGAEHLAMESSRLIALFLLTTIVIIIIVGLRITHSLTRPISDLTKSLNVRNLPQLDAECSSLSKNTRVTELFTLFSETGRMAGDIQKMQEELIKAAKHTAIAQVASQVAHDIRSPLAALDMVVQQTAQLPEEKRILIRSSVSIIRDIANNLLQKNREISSTSKVDLPNTMLIETMTTQLLSSLIDPLITEKRMQFRPKIGIEIDGRLDQASYGLFAKIQPTEFKRMISNLVNNAVEVLGEKGTVTISLCKTEDNQIQLKVQDNGKGIPPEILARLGQRGETHDKEGGSGLGLYHARTTIESWRGKLEIQSEVGKGTAVIVTLPQEHPPEWFVSELQLLPNSTIVVLDDDSSIHQVWQGRFDSLHIQEKGIKILHFSTPDDITSWVHDNTEIAKTTMFLADYELLGHKQTGLDIIETLQIGPQSILVTSRFEEKQIMEGCKRLKVRMIPKGLAAFVPITVRDPILKLDLVLIDDDNLVHIVWKMAAKEHKKVLLTYDTPAKFFMDADFIPLTTPIYVDSQLADGVKGEVVTKDIWERGFKTIYLATGARPQDFPPLPHLSGIQGKDPPFNSESEPARPVDLQSITSIELKNPENRQVFFHDILKPAQRIKMILSFMLSEGPESESEQLLRDNLSVTKRTRESLENRAAPFDLTSTLENDICADYFINQFKSIESLIDKLLLKNAGDLEQIKQEANQTARINEKLVMRLNKT